MYIFSRNNDGYVVDLLLFIFIRKVNFIFEI